MTDEQKPNQTITTGDVNSKYANIGSGSQTITENVSTGDVAAAGVRDELKALIAELRTALTALPPEKAEAVEAVKIAVEDVEAEIEKPEANQKRLVIRADALKQAAENLLAVAPIAGKIAVTLLRLGA